MATFTNEAKNASTMTNQSKAVRTDVTWDEATFTWDGAGGATWDSQPPLYTNEAKNSASFSNQSKS